MFNESYLTNSNSNKDNRVNKSFNRTNFTLISLLFIYLLMISFVSLAKPYEPLKNEIVAKWDASTNSNTRTLVQVAEHLQQAQFPGQANIHHSMARSILLYLAEAQQNNPEYWYLLARSLQHQHKFDQALVALDNALKINVNFPSAWLLKANILMAQTKFKEAKKACTQLMGNTDLIMVATCSLEVASYEGELLQSYQQLSTIFKRSQTLEYAVDEHFWRIQVIADMALRLGKPKDAAQWMDTVLVSKHLANMPLSFITLWADIQRDLGAHKNISAQLRTVLNNDNFKDDALLVRLAMADKATNTVSAWHTQIRRRIQLRLQRNDYFHAADIARYYLYVNPSPEEALKWAKVNYQQAQLFDDEKLLKEAQKLNKTDVSKGDKNVSG